MIWKTPPNRYFQIIGISIEVQLAIGIFIFTMSAASEDEFDWYNAATNIITYNSDMRPKNLLDIASKLDRKLQTQRRVRVLQFLGDDGIMEECDVGSGPKFGPEIDFPCLYSVIAQLNNGQARKLIVWLQKSYRTSDANRPGKELRLTNTDKASDRNKKPKVFIQILTEIMNHMTTYYWGTEATYLKSCLPDCAYNFTTVILR